MSSAGKNKDTNNGEMTFWDHLEALRWVLFRVVAVLFVALVGCFIAMPHIFDEFILGPTTSDFFLYKLFGSLGRGGGMMMPDFSDDGFHVDIININVATQFLTHVSTSFWLALLVTFPYLIYEIWRFVSPALFPEEKKGVKTAFVAGGGLFYVGCVVGYCVVFPLTFRFLAQYTLGGTVVNQISLNSYMSNFLTIVFVMGVVFEMPMLAWLLSSLGILHKELLKEYRKYAVVVLLVLAAVITPSGDPFTLSVVFLPLYLLYELSILVVKKAPPEED